MGDRLIPVGSLRRDLCWSVRRVTEVLLDGGPRAVYRRIRHRLHVGPHMLDIYLGRLALVFQALIPNSKYGCSNIQLKLAISSLCAKN
jgi:hypothetical protein